MNLSPLVEMLEEKGVGEQGVSLFLERMPITEGNAILLREPLTGTIIDYELPGYFKTSYRVIVRGVDYLSGRSMIGEVVKTLTFQEMTISNMYFRYSRPEAQPVSYPLSEGGLFEFVVNMNVCFSEV